MIKRNQHIVRALFLIIVTVNFSFSAIAIGIGNEKDSCSIENKTVCCCEAHSVQESTGCHSGAMVAVKHLSNEHEDELSVCNCNHMPGIDTGIIPILPKVDHLNNIQLLSTTSIEFETENGSLVDYSILDVRINPPPIFITISSFLI